MKKTINGKKYNTETAEEVGRHSSGGSSLIKPIRTPRIRGKAGFGVGGSAHRTSSAFLKSITPCL